MILCQKQSVMVLAFLAVCCPKWNEHLTFYVARCRRKSDEMSGILTNGVLSVVKTRILVCDSSASCDLASLTAAVVPRMRSFTSNNLSFLILHCSHLYTISL